jgi:hypothetical protein
MDCEVRTVYFFHSFTKFLIYILILASFEFYLKLNAKERHTGGSI